MSEVNNYRFICTHEAWYREYSSLGVDQSVVAEIILLRDAEDGGWQELYFRWFKLSHELPHPRLMAFDDQWAAFLDPAIQGLLATLGDLKDSHIQPDEFKQLLLDQGFEDATVHQMPPSPFRRKPTRYNIFGQEVAS